jgi:hypothetical protein
MGLINWIFDFYQHTQIEKARSEAAEARAELASVRSGGGDVDAARLQTTLEEFALATKALQRTLVEKGICTSDEFAKTLREIDLEDGVEDGKRRLK